MSDELDDLIQGFVEESREAFESIETDLLRIEENPEDLSIINGIFRVLHTIKGTAGFMGLDDISHLSHSLESIFDQIRKEEMAMTPELMDQMLPAIDLLKLMVLELLAAEKSSYELSSTMELLDSILQREGAPTRTEVAQAAPAQSAPVEEASPALLQDFVLEAEEHLEAIEQHLLNLEKEPDDAESINEVFRATHSIKGTSSYVNLTKITNLAHKLETCFDRVRKGRQRYSNEMADVVLKGVDLLKSMIGMIKMKEDYNIFDINEVCVQLDPFAQGEEQVPPPAPKAEVQSNDDAQFKAFLNLASQQVISIQAIGADLIAGKMIADDLMVLHRSVKTLDNGAKKQGIHPVLEQTGKMNRLIVSLLAEEISQEEAASRFQESIGQLMQVVELMQDLGAEGFAQAFDAEKSATSPPAEQPPAKKAQATTSEPPKVPKKDEENKTMRIDSNRLDSFMNLIGELIIARNSLNHILGEIPPTSLPPEVLSTLRQVEGAFNRISENLQDTLMEMRLVPVKSVFQKIPRIIRDIARKTGKNINLQMIGENTQIDKSVAEVLSDPLVHIIRNSCDHGIESVEKRKEAGKPEMGNIILKASHQGNSVILEIIDDGAGVNTEKVLQKAIEKGLVRPDQAPQLDVKTINAFIFAPGFSTADQVSDISGRGVGMDVVMTNIQKVHGAIEVDSELGNGTQIRLILPLTLSIIDALLVVDKGQYFAIPLEAVKESIEIKLSDLHRLKNKEAINLRGDIIGVSRLAQLLDLEKEQKEDAVVSVVFIQVGSRIMGLVVDDLVNQQEIVVKPLQDYLLRIPGISGSTILGSGDIILILDPAELIDLSTH